jgi:hypothetical protein
MGFEQKRMPDRHGTETVPKNGGGESGKMGSFRKNSVFANRRNTTINSNIFYLYVF